MKKILLLAAMVVAGATSYAQISVGAFGGAGIPMGDFKDAKFKTGFGGGISGRYWINDNMAAGANFAYYKMSNEASDDITTSFMPITLAFDYYFLTEGFKPYAGIEAGLTPTKAKVTLPFFGTTETSETPFSFGIVLGAAYGLSDQLDIFANVKYFSVATSGNSSAFLPINVGVNYKFD